MRKAIYTFIALAAGVGLTLVSFGAQATPVNVNLQACTITSGNWCNSGSASFTSGGVTFSGWQANSMSSPFNPADLTYKNGGPDEVGLGVLCSQSGGNKCNQHEINTIPPQYIAASIPTHTSSLSIGVQSVDSGGGSGMPETALIYGSTCADFSSCLVAIPLASYTYNGTNRTWVFNFTATQLSSFSYLYITPLGASAPDGNILLGSFSYNVSVPEPEALGIFGLGVLLIGVFAGLRRRTR